MERGHRNVLLIDPKLELIALLLTQAPAQRMHYRYLMRTLVYQAITN